MPRAESIAAANYLDHRVVEDRYADRLKVVNFQPVKDERKSWEEMTASGVAVSDYVNYFLLQLTFLTLSTLQPVQPPTFPWPLPERQAMVMWPPCWKMSYHLTAQTRTNMSATGVE